MRHRRGNVDVGWYILATAVVLAAAIASFVIMSHVMGVAG